MVGERRRARDLLRRDDRPGRQGPPEARHPGQLGRRPRARYNARVLAGHLARTRFGIEPDRPIIAPDAVAGFLATELAEGPELFHQRGYLAHVLTADRSGRLRDDGVQPLAHVLDAGGPDAIAATLEADGTGAIYPVIYSRLGGRIVERAIDPDPLLRFDTTDTRLAIADLAARGRGRLAGARPRPRPPAPRARASRPPRRPPRRPWAPPPSRPPPPGAPPVGPAT